ncbi:MAG: DUF4145 domain-containing protein [Geopsychrobacter sp.]|nr:DUF4145 domain-containing protein [Geopsychrobacter sp.]
MSTEYKVIRSHCNECGPDREHRVIAQTTKSGSEAYDRHYSIEWQTDSFLIECCGCREATLKKTYWHSEIDREDNITASYYPSRVSRKKPKWVSQLSYGLRALLGEIYSSLHAGNLRLAMMGARTVLDTYMVGKVGDVGGFEQTLKELTKQGYLADKNKDILEAALDVGHAASHRGHEPSDLEADHVMDIVENLIQTDILTSAAGDLRKSTPARKK